MQSAASMGKVSKARLWTGRVLSYLVVLMFCMGIEMYFTSRPILMESMAKYGYSARAAVVICVVEFIIAILMAVPQTAVFGVLMMTAYLGGAVSTHVRAGEPFFLPIVVAVIAWAGLMLREPRLSELLPFRR